MVAVFDTVSKPIDFGLKRSGFRLGVGFGSGTGLAMETGWG